MLKTKTTIIWVKGSVIQRKSNSINDFDEFRLFVMLP
jgi:hypothetical protein